jgi:hypothetical protein
MDAKRGKTFGAPAGDTYDLAVGLRQRLAETVRPQGASVTAQLQSAARERLGSDRTFGVMDRLRLRSRRRGDPA